MKQEVSFDIEIERLTAHPEPITPEQAGAIHATCAMSAEPTGKGSIVQENGGLKGNLVLHKNQGARLRAALTLQHNRQQ